MDVADEFDGEGFNVMTEKTAPPAPMDNGKPVPSDEPVAVFDSNALSDWLSGDAALIRKKIINIFLEDTPKIMRELEQAIQKQQGNDAARLVHAIKDCAATIGGLKVCAVTVKVETACKMENWPEAEALIPQLSRQFEMLERAMREFLKT